jgi:glycosyltransferase involved in cell wall biosynthesis
VDYGNYPFLFDLASYWPADRGQLSYLFGMQQIARNTAVKNTNELASGGVVRALHVRRTAAADNFIARQRMEAEAGRTAVDQLTALNPDLVIGANNPLDVQVRIEKWCRQRGKPFVFWLQDLRGAATQSILQSRIPLFGRLLGRYYARAEHSLLRQSAHIIAIAEDFCSEVLSAGVHPDKISIIPNWAPIARLPIRPRENAWSRQHRLAEKRVILYTGNLGMKHNPALLLALCKAVKQNPEIVVVVVADGVGADWLRTQAKQQGLVNLHSHSLVNSDVLPDVLGAAEFMVVLLEPDASAYSVPSKTWTCLCAGKPLVMAMPKENQAALIVRRIGAGVCSHPRDEAGFVENCLDMLAKTPDERAAIGAHGRAFAESNFHLPTISERVSRCIDLAFQQERTFERFEEAVSRRQRSDRFRTRSLFRSTRL